jgi:hypothetical protein
MDKPISLSLREFQSNLTPAEVINFKLILGLAAGGLADGFKIPLDHENVIAFQLIREELLSLSQVKLRVGLSGVVWQGRPNFLTDVVLQDLIEEAKELRKKAAKFDNHFISPGASIANRLATSFELYELVSKYAGTVKPTGVASILYYEDEGQGIPPHIDTDIFSLNVILMLEHRCDAIPDPSALVVFPPNDSPKRIHLASGEMVIMYAGSIIHGREPLHKNEQVTIITFGFQPITTSNTME